MEETKIIYHIDDEETPYLVKLNISPDRVTLADFKNVLNRPNYKYFFKSMDDDFGWVSFFSFPECLFSSFSTLACSPRVFFFFSLSYVVHTASADMQKRTIGRFSLRCFLLLSLTIISLRLLVASIRKKKREN